ncbi:hypothetical protein [Escherichia phage Ioannina]|nr:hypothetical protein [Escherichia phage Ioannina]
MTDTIQTATCIKRGLHNGRSSGRHHAKGGCCTNQNGEYCA